MKISQSLANRILRNASSHEPSAQLYLDWPALPYTPLLPSDTRKVAAVRRGNRSYDLLQETLLSATEVKAFYVNRLRLAGWQYYSAERREAIALTGLSRKPQISQADLSFYHPGKNLVLRLHPMESEPKSSFLLSIEDASRIAELRVTACQSHLNLVPMPFLMPMEGAQYRGGSASGNEHLYREVRLLESPQSLAQVFRHYQSQIVPEWQLESEQVGEQLAYGRWHHTDTTGMDWRLFLCLTTSAVVAGYAIFLTVEAITPHSILPVVDSSRIEVELVEQLLHAKHPDLILYTDEFPRDLHRDFPPLAEAETLAVAERPQQQRTIWLKLAGSSTDVYNAIARQLEATGWKPVPSANFPNDAGFIDTGFHAIAPVIFAQTNNPNQRIRLWTTPTAESAVIVEMLVDSLPNGKEYSFEPRTPPSGEQVENYPTLLLNPPSDSFIYSPSPRMGLWEWNDSAEIVSASSLEQIVSHYKNQLVNAGWQETTDSQLDDSQSVSVSSWRLSDQQGKVWQALLQIAQREKENSYAASLQVVTLKPSFE